MQIQKSQYITLAAVARECPGSPSPNTCWRWCRRGVPGRNGEIIRLGHVRIGGKIFVYRAALNEFFEATADADMEFFSRSDEGSTAAKRPRKPSERERALANADAQLEAAGA